MALTDMNPGNLGGTLILLLLFAALLSSFNTAINHIRSQTSGITEIMVVLIVPIIVLAILANLFEDDGDVRRR